jgi:hypothetical protein
LIVRARMAVLSILLALAPPAWGGAEGKAYDFRQVYRDGQEFNILFSQSLQVKAKLYAHGTVVQTLELVDATQDKGLLKVLQTADGVPSVEEVTLDPSCGEFHQQTGQPPRQSFTTMAGKKVTVQREPTGDIYVEVNGSRDAKLASQLHNWLDRDANLYPGRPVRLHDKWDLSRKFGRVVNATRGQDVTAFCQLKAVKNVKGREFAELLVSCAMTGTLMGSMQTETQMEGTAWVDLATGRVAKLDVAGDLRVTGTMVVNLSGKTTSANVIGDGRFEYHQLCFATKHKDAIGSAE